jgi:hypothetical protein
MGNVFVTLFAFEPALKKIFLMLVAPRHEHLPQ